jgi:hypothetical protein
MPLRGYHNGNIPRLMSLSSGDYMMTEHTPTRRALYDLWEFEGEKNEGPRMLFPGCPLKNRKSRNVDGSPFRLSLRVREHNNQTDAHVDVNPNDLDAVSAWCCSKESCTRDAKLRTAVAWKQEKSFLSCSEYLPDF